MPPSMVFVETTWNLMSGDKYGYFLIQPAPPFSQDDGTCGTFTSLADCATSGAENVNVAGVGSSCEWDEDSRTCFMPEPDEDMETSLVISTISLILTLPLDVVIVAVFGAFIVRPTKGPKEAKKRWEERGGVSQRLPGNRTLRCLSSSGCLHPALAVAVEHPVDDAPVSLHAASKGTRVVSAGRDKVGSSIRARNEMGTSKLMYCVH